MVQDKSEQVWRFYRYSLVYEFYDRPMFCPPFIIFVHIYRMILWITRKTCSTKKYHNEFSKTFNMILVSSAVFVVVVISVLMQKLFCHYSQTEVTFVQQLGWNIGKLRVKKPTLFAFYSHKVITSCN